MIANRSVPAATVIPVLAYPDVVEAADWLSEAPGFKLRLHIADHRAQLGSRSRTSIPPSGGGVLVTPADHA